MLKTEKKRTRTITKKIADRPALKSLKVWVVFRNNRHVATIHALVNHLGAWVVEVYEDNVRTYQGHDNNSLTDALQGAVICGTHIYGGSVEPKDHPRVQELKDRAQLPEKLRPTNLGLDIEVGYMGMRFANNYKDIYYVEGIKRLEYFGYNVIQAF